MKAAVEPRLLRLSETSVYLGVSVSKLYALIEQGVLSPLTLPGLRGPRFDITDLEELVKQSKSKSGALTTT